MMASAICNISPNFCLQAIILEGCGAPIHAWPDFAKQGIALLTSTLDAIPDTDDTGTAELVSSNVRAAWQSDAEKG